MSILDAVNSADFPLPEGYGVREFLPGIWEYHFEENGIEMSSGSAWNNKAHAVVGAWVSAYCTLQDSTPAAPGIDLASLLDIVSDLSQSAKVDDYEPQQIAFIESIRNRLLALIDASPKGGSDAVATKKNCPPPSWMFPEDEDPVPAANVTDWRAKAAAWLEEQAAEQENTNKAYPAHVAAYPSWTDRVHWLRTLASKVSESQATSAEVGA